VGNPKSLEPSSSTSINPKKSKHRPTINMFLYPVTARKGVKILCPGELALQKQNPTAHKDNKCVEVTIPANHPIYQQPPTSISSTMLLPLLMFKLPLDPAWSTNPSASSNPSATNLNLNAHPASPDWGTAPAQWRGNVGSVLICRRDGKDLTAFQVWALIDFVESYLKPEMERAKIIHARKSVIAQCMSPSTFERHVKEFFAKEVVVEEDWDKVISLYKV
jgi:hypothetical protein